jgi:hypothetical protein
MRRQKDCIASVCCGEMIRLTARSVLFVLSIGVTAVNLGCSVRSITTSVPSRIFREVHGLRVRSYQITPLSDDLRQYRRAEIRPLQNLMLNEVPESVVEQLHAEIIKRIRSGNRFERIAQVAEATDPTASFISESSPDLHNTDNDNSTRELVVEGYLDDYTPGIPALRYIEQGNNHAILTLRISLKDKLTGRILGEKNITVENTRVTSNVERMVIKAAKEVARFVGSNSGLDKRHEEARGHAR